MTNQRFSCICHFWCCTIFRQCINSIIIVKTISINAIVNGYGQCISHKIHMPHVFLDFFFFLNICQINELLIFHMRQFLQLNTFHLIWLCLVLFTSKSKKKICIFNQQLILTESILDYVLTLTMNTIFHMNLDLKHILTIYELCSVLFDSMKIECELISYLCFLQHNSIMNQNHQLKLFDSIKFPVECKFMYRIECEFSRIDEK